MAFFAGCLEASAVHAGARVLTSISSWEGDLADLKELYWQVGLPTGLEIKMSCQFNRQCDVVDQVMLERGCGSVAVTASPWYAEGLRFSSPPSSVKDQEVGDGKDRLCLGLWRATAGLNRQY